MKAMEFDPGKVLGRDIIRLSRRELCELAVKLCVQIRSEAGTRAYRGGIYPENISVDASGGVSLGLARQKDWAGQELQFLPPELYWNGKRGSFSDVYALGLLLYYAVSKGRLPFEGECQDPQRRRMDGENFKAPKAAGARLGEIIEKATRFNPEERYANVEELQIMLEGLVKNQYESGAPIAEAIFKKSDEELTDLERIMVGIIEKGDPELDGTGPEPEDETQDEPDPPPEETGGGEDVRVYEPSHRRNRNGGFTASAPAGAPSPRQIVPIPVLTEEKNPELAPVTPSRETITPAVQYGKSAARERKIAAEVKKRRRRPAAVILVLCALLIVMAIIANAMLRDFAWNEPEPTSAPSTATPPASNGGVIVGSSDVYADSGAAEAPVEMVSTYELVREDVSWTEARDRCIRMGGHLAVITDVEEYNEIVALAEERGIPNLWIGLYRIGGDNLWVTGEETDFVAWDLEAGEPSFTDSYDNVPEDYVMLWNHNGGWYYNDSREDPLEDYGWLYSGSIGYICEYETPADELPATAEPAPEPTPEPLG